MKPKAILQNIKPPCQKCPYKLGMIKTPINPCPQCKLNHYHTYEQFKEQLSKEFPSRR